MLKRELLNGTSVAVLVLAGLMIGCSTPSTPSTDPAAASASAHKAQVAAVRAAAQGGVSIGLKVWAKDHAEAAKEAATALSKNANEVLVPYLSNQGALPSSQEVQAFVESSLFKGVDGTLKDALITASAVLDMALPVPGADKLTPDAADFLLAFVKGAAAGCDDFLGTSKAVRSPAVWLK